MIKQYLLTLLSASQPRRIRVVENVLKNKRTVANLFWAQSYGLLPWLGADPHLERREYEHSLGQLRQRGWLRNDREMLQLTPEGERAQKSWQADHYQPHFFRYYWVTNPHRLARRALLAIQSLSELEAHNSRYVPITLSIEDTTAVKKWLLGSKRDIIGTVGQQCLQFAQQLSSVDSRLAELFSSELVGHQTSGVPAQREATILGVSPEELFLIDRDLWLAFGCWSLKGQTSLGALVRPLLNQSPLASSAQETVNAFHRGQSIEQISTGRHLKISTIREHLLAAAILTPNQLDWERLLPPEERVKLARRYHGPVTSWRFAQAGQHDPVAFFNFRLYQIRKELDDDRHDD